MYGLIHELATHQLTKPKNARFFGRDKVELSTPTWEEIYVCRSIAREGQLCRRHEIMGQAGEKNLVLIPMS